MGVEGSTNIELIAKRSLSLDIAVDRMVHELDFALPVKPALVLKAVNPPANPALCQEVPTWRRGKHFRNNRQPALSITITQQGKRTKCAKATRKPLIQFHRALLTPWPSCSTGSGTQSKPLPTPCSDQQRPCSRMLCSLPLGVSSPSTDTCAR